MSGKRHTEALDLPSLALLALLVSSCSVPDGLMVTLRTPTGSVYKVTSSKSRTESRRSSFRPGIQTISDKRTLATDPLKVWRCRFRSTASSCCKCWPPTSPTSNRCRKGNSEPQYFLPASSTWELPIGRRRSFCRCRRSSMSGDHSRRGDVDCTESGSCRALCRSAAGARLCGRRSSRPVISIRCGCAALTSILWRGVPVTSGCVIARAKYDAAATASAL